MRRALVATGAMLLATTLARGAPLDVPRSPCPPVFPAHALHLDRQVGEWATEIAEPAFLFRLDFFTGPPERLGLLRPYSESNTSTDSVTTWQLPMLDEGTWIECVYEGGIALSRRLDPSPARCVLRHTWNDLHLPENLSLTCWR